jgi:hypothetical protein
MVLAKSLSKVWQTGSKVIAGGNTASPAFCDINTDYDIHAIRITLTMTNFSSETQRTCKKKTKLF